MTCWYCNYQVTSFDLLVIEPGTFTSEDNCDFPSSSYELSSLNSLGVIGVRVRFEALLATIEVVPATMSILLGLHLIV